MHLVEDVTAAYVEYLDALTNLPAYVFGRALDQRRLGLASGAMFAALVCTGLSMSTPASIRSGISSYIPPQECRKTGSPDASFTLE